MATLGHASLLVTLFFFCRGGFYPSPCYLAARLSLDALLLRTLPAALFCAGEDGDARHGLTSRVRGGTRMRHARGNPNARCHTRQQPPLTALLHVCLLEAMSVCACLGALLPFSYCTFLPLTRPPRPLPHSPLPQPYTP